MKQNPQKLMSESDADIFYNKEKRGNQNKIATTQTIW